MSVILLLAGVFLFLITAVHFISLVMIGYRCRQSAPAPELASPPPPVTVLIPVAGIENYLEDTLTSAFHLDYPDYEIIFCSALATDPAVAVVKRLMAKYSQVRSRLLIGDERPSINPKLNNTVKGWEAAQNEWIVMADSNVLLPKNAVQEMMSRWREGTGLVCSPPNGTKPDGLWAELEAGFLNTYQLRWQLMADESGAGFAQGKVMLWRRSYLEEEGGIRALGAEPGEDAAATKIFRRKGMQVRLVRRPFPQPLGDRTFPAVWKRQLRWARLRRASFPHLYPPELLAGSMLPFLALILLVAGAGLSPAWILAFAFFWYGGEALLAWWTGWPLSPLSPLAWIIRDLMLPVLWLGGWGNTFVWRGNGMDITTPEELKPRWTLDLALDRLSARSPTFAAIRASWRERILDRQ